ncbi:DUF3180 domain-containing protein [Nocardioides pacificus]
MTSGPPGSRQPSSGRPDPGPPERRLQPTSWQALLGWGLAGLVGGWAVRPLFEWISGTAPLVTWLQVSALLLVAVLLAVTAWLTWRVVHVRHERLEPQQAVNRLVLARACALVGALVAGGYLGYALSWVGASAQLADQRVVRSLVAAAAGVAIAITSLLLERACRVRSDPDAP